MSVIGHVPSSVIGPVGILKSTLNYGRSLGFLGSDFAGYIFEGLFSGTRWKGRTQNWPICCILILTNRYLTELPAPILYIHLVTNTYGHSTMVPIFT
jgi:hypothetical protein